MHLEISRGVGNQGKAGGMGFRKAIEGEGGNVLNNVVLGGGIQPILRHAAAELSFQLLHALPGTAHADGTA